MMTPVNLINCLHEAAGSPPLLTAVVLTCILFALALADLVNVRRKRMNGPMRFMTLNNVRHQGMILLGALTIVWWTCHVPDSGHNEILTVLAWGLVVDAFCAFVYRRKMPQLVAEYMIGQDEGQVTVGEEFTS